MSFNNKKIEDLIRTIREEVVERSAMYLKKRVAGEDIDSEETKELRAIKSELKFLEKEFHVLTGKKGDGVENWQELVDDFVRKAQSISPTVGKIIRKVA